MQKMGNETGYGKNSLKKPMITKSAALAAEAQRAKNVRVQMQNQSPSKIRVANYGIGGNKDFRQITSKVG